MKPNAEIYLAAAKNVNTPPEHCLFIDDLQINVEGARAAGMQATRFENIDALARELKKMGLLEMPDSLGA
jgi:FMN phosphatase YigB (HAD superfamily)